MNTANIVELTTIKRVDVVGTYFRDFSTIRLDHDVDADIASATVTLEFTNIEEFEAYIKILQEFKERIIKDKP